jgi:tetratricopeptide (TPR) repeat protein
MALGMMAELYVWGHVMGFPTADDPVNTGLQLAQKAMNIDSQSKHASFSLAWASLYSTGSTDVQEQIDTLRSQNPAAAFEAAKLATVLVWAGHYDSARPVLEAAMKYNPQYPWSFDLAMCLIFFNNNQYNEALASLNKIEATDIYIVDLMKTVLFDKLGAPKKARPHLHSLKENYSFIASDLRKRLGNFLCDKSLISKILAGAKEAGLSAE